MDWSNLHVKQKEILELAMLGVIRLQDNQNERVKLGREDAIKEVRELDEKLLALAHLLYREETKLDNDNKA